MDHIAFCDMGVLECKHCKTREAVTGSTYGAFHTRHNFCAPVPPIPLASGISRVDHFALEFAKTLLRLGVRSAEALDRGIELANSFDRKLVVGAEAQTSIPALLTPLSDDDLTKLFDDSLSREFSRITWADENDPFGSV